jgi:hypothetical protein
MIRGRGLRPSGLDLIHRLAVALTLACRAARQVARCRARFPASAPAPVITHGADAGSAPVPACTARPNGPPFRRLLTTASATAMVWN